MELKNGETYNGHLVSCDNWMNINLREVICTSRVRARPRSARGGGERGSTGGGDRALVPFLGHPGWASVRFWLPWQRGFGLSAVLSEYNEITCVR